MGHRANLILVNETGYEIYYCHWCALTLDEAVFWGPEFALHYVKQMQLQEKDGWQDSVWAEGGVLIDIYRKKMLLFGGEDIQWNVPLRHAYLELLHLMWEGWTIEWAHERVLSLADYVGYPQERVYWKDDSERKPVELQVLPKNEPPLTIVSIRLSNGDIWIIPIGNSLIDTLRFGKSLVSVLKTECKEGDYASVYTTTGKNGYLDGGLHIDEEEQTIHFWTVYQIRLADEVQSIWKGWKLEWLKDDYKAHTTLTDGQFIFETASDEVFLNRLRTILLDDKRSNINTFIDKLREIAESASNATLNPNAFASEPQHFAIEFRRELLENVIVRWKENNNPTPGFKSEATG